MHKNYFNLAIKICFNKNSNIIIENFLLFQSINKWKVLLIKKLE